MRKLLISGAIVVGLALLAAKFLIAPPHIFITPTQSDEVAAYGDFNETGPHPAARIFGYFVVMTSEVEGSGMVFATKADRSVRVCYIGYFTSSELEPHYLDPADCEN